jgi:hypothetical protein
MQLCISHDRWILASIEEDAGFDESMATEADLIKNFRGTAREQKGKQFSPGRIDETPVGWRHQRNAVAFSPKD